MAKRSNRSGRNDWSDEDWREEEDEDGEWSRRRSKNKRGPPKPKENQPDEESGERSNLVLAVKIQPSNGHVLVGATPAQRTKGVFGDDELFEPLIHRVQSFWPRRQSVGLSGYLSIYKPTVLVPIKEMLAKLLMTDHTRESIEKVLIPEKRIWALPQVENLVRRQYVEGESIGISTNGYANTFPVLDKHGRIYLLELRMIQFKDCPNRWMIRGCSDWDLETSEIPKISPDGRLFLLTPCEPVLQ